MIYICVDCEASGPVPALYNLLSIGATVVRRGDGAHELGDSFYVELKPIFPGVDPEAVAVCGLDVDKLRREGEEPGAAMRRFAEWALAQAGEAGAPVFVGHNAVFDWAYVAYYFAHFGIANPFGYKGIDTKSLAMGRLRIPWNDTSKDVLEHRLGLPPLDPGKVHRADYDAHYQALILKGLLDIR